MSGCVAVVTARGGSKRIPGKNIKPFAGRPIIEYPIRAAQQSGLFDRIILSTDSEEIAEVGRRAGVEVPFMRPSELANDTASTGAVLAHAIEWLAEHDLCPEYLCGIYPTAPFLRAEHLAAGYKMLTASRCSCVFPVTTFSSPILRALRIGREGTMSMFFPEYESSRSNDLPEAYHDAGQFYWVASDRFMRTRRLFVPDARTLVIPRKYVQDIDTKEDWELAELQFEALRARENGNSALDGSDG